MTSEQSRSRTLSRRSIVQAASAAVIATVPAAQMVSATPGSSGLRGTSRAQSDEKLTFWIISSFTPDESAPIYEAVAKYKEATGVEVTIEATAAADLQAKLITAVKGGEGPDVVTVDSAWNAGLAAAEITTDITDRFTNLADQFFPGPVETGAYLGKQYAAPWYTNNVALYYNKEMFTAAGIAAPPTTWDELVETGKKLTSGDQYGLMMGGSGFGSFCFWPFAFQNGATLISDDGKSATFGDDAGREAWTFYSDLFLTDKIVPEDVKSATTAWDQVFAPFIQKRAAMMMCGDWAIYAIKDGAPDLDFGIAPLPVGKEAATVIGGYNLAIPTTTDKTDAAWDFINWLIAVDQEWILQGYNRIQARADIVDTEYASKDPLMKVFIDQAGVGKARATVPAWNEIENTIMADAWDSVILGEAAPDDALDTAVSDANDVLAE